MPLHVSSTCAHYQEVKIALHSLWYHHTYRCDDTSYRLTFSFTLTVWLWGREEWIKAEEIEITNNNVKCNNGDVLHTYFPVYKRQSVHYWPQ